jgi:hypothetical protein
MPTDLEFRKWALEMSLKLRPRGITTGQSDEQLFSEIVKDAKNIIKIITEKWDISNYSL